MARDPKAPCGPMGRTRHVHSIFACAIALAAIWLPALTVSPASAVLPTAPSLIEICNQASRLAQDSPETALAFIESARAGAIEETPMASACEALRLTILFKQADSTIADRESPAAAPTDLTAFCDAVLALATEDPQKSLDLVKKLRDSAPEGTAQDCPEARLAAVNELATSKENSTPPEVASSNWTDGVTKWVMPIAGILAAVSSIVLVALIAARLLVLLPTDLSKSRYLGEIKVESARLRFIRTGLAKIVGGSVLIGLVIATLPVADLLPVIERVLSFIFLAQLLVASAFVVLLGTLQVARALASTLAMNITVHASDGNANEPRKSALIAYISELGSAQPRAVQVQQASDITALAESALPSSTNPVLTVLRSIFTTVVGQTPWSITVDSSSATRAAVLISRNGRSVATALVETDRWKVAVGDAKIDADKMAAAVVISTLAEHYDDFNGLNGATKWDSIGLHFVATSDYRNSPQTRALLLAAAIDADYRNKAAKVALKQALYAQTSDPQEIQLYALWLSEQSDIIDGTPARSAQQQYKDGVLDLHRRVLVNFAVAAVNLASGPTMPNQPTPDLDPGLVFERANRLKQLIGADTPPSGGFRDRVANFSKGVLAAIDELYGAGPVNPVPSSASDLGNRQAYNAACNMVLRGLRLDSGTPADVSKLRELFRLAFQHSELKAWARDDPALRQLRSDPEFAKLVANSSGSTLWDLAPFKPLKEKLNDIGVASPSQFHSRPFDPTLGYYLQISESQRQNLADISKLFHAAEDVTWADSTNTSGDAKIEILAELLLIGVRVPSDIRSEWTETTYPGDTFPTDPSIVDTISSNIYKRTWRRVDVHQLARWLHDVRQRGEELGF